MRAFVTGGAGFIGSHLSEALLRAGHEVTVLDDLSTGSPLNIVGLLDHPGFRFVRGSILDEDTVDGLVAWSDRVFHLAAAVGVHTIVDDPIRSLRTNLEGAEHVLSATRRHDRRVLMASTSEVYGKNTADALAEDADRIMGSPLRSRWSYAEAKALDELVASTYARRDGLRVVIARLFNTVGPRQSGRYGMVVPRLIGQALRGAPLSVHGDGRQTRCFCHVADIVPALVQLIDTPAAYGSAVNLGNPSEISIRSLAERIIARTGSPSGVELTPYDDVYGEGYEDMRRRVPDIRRAHELIGFVPTRTLDDVIDDVAAVHGMRESLDALRWRPPVGGVASPDARPTASAPGSRDVPRNGNGNGGGRVLTSLTELVAR